MSNQLSGWWNVAKNFSFKLAVNFVLYPLLYHIVSYCHYPNLCDCTLTPQCTPKMFVWDCYVMFNYTKFIFPHYKIHAKNRTSKWENQANVKIKIIAMIIFLSSHLSIKLYYNYSKILYSKIVFMTSNNLYSCIWIIRCLTKYEYILCSTNHPLKTGFALIKPFLTSQH